jgi:hypothetical protein
MIEYEDYLARLRWGNANRLGYSIRGLFARVDLLVEVVFIVLCEGKEGDWEGSITVIS